METEGSGQDRLEGCIGAAQELLALLEEESSELRLARKERLLEITARKESLAIGLAGKLRALPAPEPGFKDEGRSTLRGLLTEISRTNERNRIFIQGYLDCWQDLVRLLMPGTYGAAQEGRPAPVRFSAKGLSLSREA